MDAKELRIGNYFNLINRSGEVHIPISHPLEIAYFGLFDKVIFCEPNENICQISHPRDCQFYDMSPIPLTEELLIKLGFEKKDIKHSDDSISKGVYKIYPVLINDNRLYEDEGRYIISRFVPSEINRVNFLTHIDYVHQLQNLYFALTGNELKIK